MDCCSIVQTEKTKAQSWRQVFLGAPREVVAVGLSPYPFKSSALSPGPLCLTCQRKALGWDSLGQ